MKILILLATLVFVSCKSGSEGSAGLGLNPLLYGTTWTREVDWCPGNNCTGGITYLDERLEFVGYEATFQSYTRGTNNKWGALVKWELTPVDSETVHVFDGTNSGRFTYTVDATTLEVCDPDSACVKYFK